MVRDNVDASVTCCRSVRATLSTTAVDERRMLPGAATLVARARPRPPPPPTPPPPPAVAPAATGTAAAGIVVDAIR